MAEEHRSAESITKETLLQDLKRLAIDRAGTLLVHSSMKSIGPACGGPDAVLDALADYMRDGLLVLPTHTWAYVNKDGAEFRVADSLTCVGLLTERFRKRPGVFRSWHPTHSVAALGRDAESFVAGDERFPTPCARGSAWGRLLDRQATILLIGVDLTRNTFIHGIEEWADIPNRLADEPKQLYTIAPDGARIAAPVRGHTTPVWEHYGKVDELLQRKSVMRLGRFGHAETRVCDAAQMTTLLSAMLRVEPDLFLDDTPIDPGRYGGLV
ncbi:AAC(3) family N-acetyltransferase [Paenibacillus cymbidii]|uniref:AAC(3) family N-acetyltransferase n=1 Tax=Paenibacillus cymbidii TaxID=1639034 RepID=UPI0010804F8C|nr:AAC(3) family N-acetyltransferase [Paenibacillus cymbidii]